MNTNNTEKIEKLALISPNYSGRATIYEYFFTFPNIQINKDFGEVEKLDCIICPCSNSFGIPEGPAKQICEYLGQSVVREVQKIIAEECFGEQPKGSCLLVKVPSTAKAKIKYICWVALGRTPEDLSKDYAYSGLWSALCTIQGHNKKVKENKKKLIQVVAVPCINFSESSDTMRDNCRQMALAYSRSDEPSEMLIELEATTKYHSDITKIQNRSILPLEKEKELEGLLWSRELERRGLCGEDELDIIIKWVNDDSSHSVSAAKIMCSLLRRPDTEFTVPSRQICERITSKTSGCLTKLIEMGLKGLIDVHNEINRSELTFGLKIGDGTAGSVYRGTWTGKEVAIKVFNSSAQYTLNETEFRRELALLSLIQHPLVLKCFGGSTKKGDYLIVTELMEASVYDMLHDESFELDESTRLNIAMSTAKCMAFLHSCGLMHRDLKSLNLLVNKELECKICDFGLSRFVDRQTQMTNNIGTIAWIAPELFQKKFYTEKADVYSYGIIMWELVSRKIPFNNVESFTIPIMVTRGERPSVPKDCPSDWKKLIKACWNQKPTSRPSFKKILAKLREMQEMLRRSKLQTGEDYKDLASKQFKRNTNHSTSSISSISLESSSMTTSYNPSEEVLSDDEPSDNESSSVANSVDSNSSTSAPVVLKSATVKKVAIEFTDFAKAIVKVPDSYNNVFSKAEREIYQNFQGLNYDPSKALIRTTASRYLLLRTEALTTDVYDLVKSLQGFDADQRQEFVSNLLFDLGFALGIENIKQAEEKIRIDNTLELISLLPVRLAFEGWASTEILPQSYITDDDDFLMVWEQSYSFEAESWLAHREEVSPTCVCCMTCGYYSGWIGRVLRVPVVAAEISCRARGDSTCRFIMSASGSLEIYLKAYASKNPQKIPEDELKKMTVPAYIKQRISDPKYEKNWLVQLLSHMDTSLTMTVSSALNVSTDYVKRTAETYEEKQTQKRKSSGGSSRKDIKPANSLPSIAIPPELANKVKASANVLSPKGSKKINTSKLKRAASPSELFKMKIFRKEASLERLNPLLPDKLEREAMITYNSFRIQPDKYVNCKSDQSTPVNNVSFFVTLFWLQELKLMYYLIRGCIEINDKNFVLVRSDVLTILGEVLKNLIDQAQIPASMRDDFVFNFMYELGRVWGMREGAYLRGLFNTIGEEIDHAKIKNAFLIPLALSGWSNGYIFASRINETDKFDLTGMSEAQNSSGIPDDFFALGIALRHSAEGDGITHECALPHCPTTAGLVAASLGVLLSRPLQAVEVNCIALDDDQCGFIIAHPQYIEQYIHNFSNTTGNGTTTLEMLTRLRDFKMNPSATKGHWLKKFVLDVFPQKRSRSETVSVMGNHHTVAPSPGVLPSPIIPSRAKK